MANCLADCFAISLDYLKTRLSRSAQESGAKGRLASVEGLSLISNSFSPCFVNVSSACLFLGEQSCMGLFICIPLSWIFGDCST